MIESAFVAEFRNRFLRRWEPDAFFYKIPTGPKGGFRPFDVFAALRDKDLISYFALEFKVERGTRLTAERLKNEPKRKHQWVMLERASRVYVAAFVLYGEKDRSIRFVPIRSDRWTAAGLHYLEEAWIEGKGKKTVEA